MQTSLTLRTAESSFGTAAGLIALVFCALICAVTCNDMLANEPATEHRATVQWISSTVDRSGNVIDVPSHTQPDTQAHMQPPARQLNEDLEAVISPQAFREHQKTVNFQSPATAEAVSTETTPIPSHDLSAPTNVASVTQSSLEASQEHQDDFTPQIPAEFTVAEMPAAEPDALPEQSIMILEPSAESNAFDSRGPAGDPPEGNPPERDASPQAMLPTPFRFASARSAAIAPTPTKQLPALPSLPGQTNNASTVKSPHTATNSNAAFTKTKKKAPGVLASADAFVMAAQPELGAHYKLENPVVDACAWKSETYLSDFSPDAIDPHMPVDPWTEMQIYEGKTLNANQRPLIELGRPWYQLGQLNPGSSLLGFHNNVAPQFLVFGDFRTAIASNQLGGNSTTLSASELNLDFDLKLTGTERFHMFMSPLDNGLTNTGYRFDDDEFVDEFDAQIDFGYFEGDLGAIVGGFMGKTLPFDLPFAIGEIPLLFQNGIWMEDAILGVAATIPARNSPRFDISNMDFTFFAGYDQLNSDAFPGDDSAARIYGMASFIEAMNGYWEIDYAFLDDRTFDDRSYHNIGIAFSRRFGRLLSNSTRVIVNAGQSTDVVENTADGVLLLSENSLITGAPSTVVPYLNLFAGFDRPQSAARAGVAGGVLRNTGILFETDGMTGFPTLDATANDTFGMSLGLNLIASDFSQQLVVETSMLGVMGNDANRNAAGDQYGLGLRYQLPLSNAIIFRTDAMYGFRRGDEDIHGARMELRHKF
jgi:hypothetical protein